MPVNDRDTNIRNVNINRPGIGHASSYMVSGTPWMSGAATIATETQHKISFPRVAREVVIINRSAPDLRVYFTDKDSGTSTFGGKHYITLTEARDSITFRSKCKEIYIYNADASTEGSYEIYAELTHIDKGEMYVLTGSGLTVGPTNDEAAYTDNDT